MQWEFASALVAEKGWEGKKMVAEADAKVVASDEVIKVKYYPSGMTSLEGTTRNRRFV